MRFVKKFEAWYDLLDKVELEEFSRIYLAYLVDDGFDIGINLDRPEDSSATDLHIFKINSNGDEHNPFLWNDIKEQFIPFLTFFKERYNFSSLKTYPYMGDGVRTFRFGGSLENLLNDNFDLEEELSELVIYIITNK